jgi:hypothetical protein
MTTVQTTAFDLVMGFMRQERERQDTRWGERHDDRHTPDEWALILAQEVGQMATAALEWQDNGEEVDRQALHVAATAVAYLESRMREAAGKAPVN